MSRPSTGAVTENAFLESYWRDPHTTLAHAREHTPVREVTFEIGPTWLVTRCADVRVGLADERLAKDYRASLPPDERAAVPPGPPAPMSRVLTSPYLPEHARLRRLVTRALTARRVATLRPLIHGVVGCPVRLP